VLLWLIKGLLAKGNRQLITTVMAADALVAVKLGVFSKKKIKLLKINGVLNVTLQWWNMTH
jgi:hypothetical protein